MFEEMLPLNIRQGGKPACESTEHSETGSQEDHLADLGAEGQQKRPSQAGDRSFVSARSKLGTE